MQPGSSARIGEQVRYGSSGNPLYGSPASRDFARLPTWLWSIVPAVGPKDRHLLTCCLLMAGCVFPAQPATGIELGWRFVEAVPEPPDGASAVIRNCVGTLVDEVEVTVRDLEDLTRETTRVYECKSGFRSDAFFVGTTDVFFELRPGNYAFEAVFVDEGEVVKQFEQEVDVSARGIEPVLLDAMFEPLGWGLSVHNVNACQTAAFGLRRADADRDVATSEPPGYGEALKSQHGLQLDGVQRSCGELIDGSHAFTSDRGHYILEISVDGQVCEVPVTVRGTQTQLDIDMAAPCPST